MKYNEEYREDLKRVLPFAGDKEALRGKSVIITGATGLICSAVVDILLEMNKTENAGIKIILAGRSEERTKARFSYAANDPSLTFLPYDATKTASYDDVKADYIIHGASNANPAAYVAQPVETMQANFIGLDSLMKIAVNSSARKVLYVSSSEVYGQKNDMEPFGEEDYGYLDILNDRAAYPSSKRAAETLCIAYGNEYGIDTVIARPGHIYGPAVIPSDNRATAQFTRNAVNHEDIVMKSAGTQLRSYCYFLDCASAILTILTKGEKGNAYNISNPASIITISAIARAIANAAGMDIKFENPDDAEAKGYSQMSNSSLKSDKLEALGWQAVFSPEEGASGCIKYYD